MRTFAQKQNQPQPRTPQDMIRLVVPAANHREHPNWYVGSPTTGTGVHVSHHVGVFYTDHGEYTEFRSAPFAAKAPAGKTPKAGKAPRKD